MLNKLKQFKDLRSQAKELQNKLSDKSVTVTEGKVEMPMDGNLKMTAINIDPEILTSDKKSKLEKQIMDAHGTALKKMQRIMAMEMKDMGGLNMPGMN